MLRPLTDNKIPTKASGRRIKWWRKRRSMSRIDLAREVGITVQHLGRIERSKSSTRQLSLIAEILGCHKEDLMI